MQGGKVKTVRKPMIAGTWYPSDPERLRADVEEYLAAAQKDIPDAYAYRVAKGGLFDVVILIGPSHRAYFRGASIYDGEGYETPLGITPVDRSLAEKIVEYGDGCVSLVPDDRLPENSLEIQVPLIQVTFGMIPFVPILMGTQDPGTCRAVADAIIQGVGDRRSLVIASSDFSHYHSYDKAVAMDSGALAYIEKMDVEEFLREIENGRIEACGAGPVAVTMMVTREMAADTVKVLKYMNSGDITGDKSGVVGYAAVALYGKDVGHRPG